MERLKKFTVQAMIDNLENMKGQAVYGADLAYQIFESENVNGSFTCSTQKAKEWIKTYWDELGEVVEEINANLGEGNVPNVFDKPEAFQVVILLEMSSQLCGQCKLIEKNWNNKFELTEKNIKTIIKQLEEQI